MRRLITSMLLLATTLTVMAEKVNIILPQGKTNRVAYAAEYLQKKLQGQGFEVVVTDVKPDKKALHRVILALATDTTGKKKEGFTISTVVKKNKRAIITVTGNDGTGCIYGCNELAGEIRSKGIMNLPQQVTDAPEMVLRGGCIGVQKPYLLPGRMVYEYPYTPELFPWLYDKQQWVD